MNPLKTASLKFVLKLLKSRDYHSAQIRDKLQNKGFSVQDIELCLGYLLHHRLINDKLYLENQAYHHLKKGYSVEYIYQKLQAKKVPITHNLLDKVAAYYDIGPSEQIAFLTADFYRKHGVPANDRDLARLNRYLLSHGHQPEMVQDNIVDLKSNSW